MANSQSVTCGAHRVAVCPPGEKAATATAALAVNSRAQLPPSSMFSCHPTPSQDCPSIRQTETTSGAQKIIKVIK